MADADHGERNVDVSVQPGVVCQAEVPRKHGA